MATWTDVPPQKPPPGTEPWTAWSWLLEVLGIGREPAPGYDCWGPCDRQMEAGS